MFVHSISWNGVFQFLEGDTIQVETGIGPRRAVVKDEISIDPVKWKDASFEAYLIKDESMSRFGQAWTIQWGMASVTRSQNSHQVLSRSGKGSCLARRFRPGGPDGDLLPSVAVLPIADIPEHQDDDHSDKSQLLK